MYNAHWLPKVLPLIEPIPRPREVDYPGRPSAYEGALIRWSRRKRSHQTLLTPQRVRRQLEARTPEEFFELEVPRSKAGKPMWHAQPRCAVNLRQMRETDTVEFRHSPGTLNEAELRYFLEWCEHYLLCALCPTWGLQPSGLNPLHNFKPELYNAKADYFPRFEPYDHALEIRYRATCHDLTLPKEQITCNIKAIEDGSFVEEEWDRWWKRGKGPG
jgi:hypothetical protein